MPTPVTCFVIMPYDNEFLPLRDVISDVVKEMSDGHAYRSDDVFSPGQVMTQLKKAIAAADFCIADVSGANPNVMWEVGYAHALGKPVIMLSQKSSTVPFDIQPERRFEYNPKRLSAIRQPLSNAIKAVVESIKGKPRLLGEPFDELRDLVEHLDRHNMAEKAHRPMISLVLAALEWDRNNRASREWHANDAPRFMEAVAEVARKEADDIFWWLLIYGVFAFDAVGAFDALAENPKLTAWEDCVDLAFIPPRGVALFNRLCEPI